MAALLRQQTHLFGYDGKAAAVNAGMRGLDRRIQRQNMGLERHAVDQRDDATHLGRLVDDPLD